MPLSSKPLKAYLKSWDVVFETRKIIVIECLSLFFDISIVPPRIVQDVINH